MKTAESTGKEKQESPGWQETTHFGVISVLEADKGREVERPKSLASEVTCGSLCPQHNQISLGDKKFPPCNAAMTRLIKAKQGQKSLLPSAKWRWNKNQEMWLPAPPSQWIFHPFICMLLITSLAKKCGAAAYLYAHFPFLEVYFSLK